MTLKEEALAKHYEWKGKIEVISRTPIKNREQLSLAYTPGVAEPCLEIAKDPMKVYELTRRQNLVAVITDGTAVLGLGDIGPEAAMPVMEGKCALFKEFAGVDAFPICIDSKDPKGNYARIRVEGDIITAQAGARLSKIGSAALSKSLSGFEFACGIPGTLGGACIMNAGAYGGEKWSRNGWNLRSGVCEDHGDQDAWNIVRCRNRQQRG